MSENVPPHAAHVSGFASASAFRLRFAASAFSFRPPFSSRAHVLQSLSPAPFEGEGTNGREEGTGGNPARERALEKPESTRARPAEGGRAGQDRPSYS